MISMTYFFSLFISLSRFYTLAYSGCVNENPDVIKALLNAGSDLNARTKKGNTPLDIAANLENSDVAKGLRTAGAARMKIAKKPQQSQKVCQRINLLGVEIATRLPHPRKLRVGKRKIRCNRHFKISRMCVGKSTRVILRIMTTIDFTAWRLLMTIARSRERKVAKP